MVPYKNLMYSKKQQKDELYNFNAHPSIMEGYVKFIIRKTPTPFTIITGETWNCEIKTVFDLLFDSVISYRTRVIYAPETVRGYGRFN